MISLYVIYITYVLLSYLWRIWQSIFVIFNQPDYTKSSADSDEGSSNGGSSPVEQIFQVSSTSRQGLISCLISHDGNIDEDGGEEVGQLEKELKSRLTSGLNGSRQTEIKSVL